MAGRPANQLDGELAALRHQHEMDALGESPVVDQVLDITVIDLLAKVYEKQVGLMKDGRFSSSEWSQQVGYGWVRDFSWLDSPRHLGSRASLARLQTTGLITQVETNIARNGLIAHQPFGLLPEGKNFYERVQKIAVEK
jgi:hypothetical protein